MMPNPSLQGTLRLSAARPCTWTLDAYALCHIYRLGVASKHRSRPLPVVAGRCAISRRAAPLTKKVSLVFAPRTQSC